jgi:hypothetical protein
MGLLPTTPPGSSVDCTSCTATRTLSVSFTPASPAPANGYIVKWKRASDTIYTTLSGANPTSSPVIIPNVPACEDVNVIVQSSCGGGQLSTEVSTVATGVGYSLKCDCAYQGTTSEMAYYQYPNIPLDFATTQNGSTITIGYNVVGRINRFTVYNVTDSTTAVTTGWAGTANYSGPWGSTNNTPSTGSIQFTYNSAKVYQLRVEAGGADPSNQLSDSWNVSMGCVYTPPPTYYYYSLNEYACVDCALGGATKVGRSSTQLSATNGTHYKVGSYSYVINTEITPAPSTFNINLDNATATGATCYIACGTTPPSNGTISISNFGGSGATLSGFTPAWFFLDTGTIPLFNLGTASGTHSGYIGNFGVTVGGAMGGCLTLTVNGTMVQNLGISSAGDYTFLNVSIPDDATVVITLDQGACQ